MPDSLPWNAFQPWVPQPDPPVYVGPKPTRPELLVDNHNVFLIDPQGNYLGFDGNWGWGGPLAPVANAKRAATRGL
jgi:hypothetical protein